ncbi:anthranilate phosphoribosyltransferase [Marinicellulosiphila megalodicopiae]|uniref:anthranilate phosphoribosyltransferase n=1 Tax=Marinicellulosiphila megalodicopiae TaxID=2724896 RepID=UPI003BB10642
MNIQQAIAKVVDKQDLSTQEMIDVMKDIMTGNATPAQIGGFLIGLRMKGETVDEIVAAVTVMRELSVKVDIQHDNLVDTCGTGGDGSNLFNVSTACAFVVAAAGGKVAKHGNRGASSKSGSADLLEQAGVKLDINPEQVIRCIDDIGVGFMFAQTHHSAMKHAIGPRKEMNTRTIFNILGPMTNPANAPNQVIGVFNSALCPVMANVLKELNSNHVLVVHSLDGLDELSICAMNDVSELKDGQVESYQVDPKKYGFNYADLSGLQVDSSAESLTLIQSALGKDKSETAQKARDMIAFNAGAAIYASNQATDLEQGIEMAFDAIYSGMALEKMNDLASFTQAMSE